MKYYPIPVIIVSSLTQRGTKLAYEALSSGALEVISKPYASYSVGDMSIQLADKIRAVAGVEVKSMEPNKKGGAVLKKADLSSRALSATTNKIIAIGAERLDKLCEVTVKEAEDGDIVSNGKVLIAPGNYHMLLRRSGARYYARVKNGPMVHHQRPAVDVLFNSVADYAGSNALGIILTGMGSDGAAGLLKMRKAKAKTIAQDEKSCVVFGMPKEAIEKGAAERTVSLENIAQTALNMI